MLPFIIVRLQRAVNRFRIKSFFACAPHTAFVYPNSVFKTGCRASVLPARHNFGKQNRLSFSLVSSPGYIAAILRSGIENRELSLCALPSRPIKSLFEIQIRTVHIIPCAFPPHNRLSLAGFYARPLSSFGVNSPRTAYTIAVRS